MIFLNWADNFFGSKYNESFSGFDSRSAKFDAINNDSERIADVRYRIDKNESV